MLYPNTQAIGGLAEDTKQAKVSPKHKLDVLWQEMPSGIAFHSNTQDRGGLEEDAEHDKGSFKYKLEMVWKKKLITPSFNQIHRLDVVENIEQSMVS